MRKTFVALLIAALLLAFTAAAEEDGFDFDFFDDGYAGEWVSLDALGIEFCLPDGWTQAEAEAGDAFAAVDDDGSAGLAIRLEADGVGDIDSWAAAGFVGGERDEAGFHEALVRETDTLLAVRFAIGDGSVIAFDFTRADAGALSRAFALQIVASVCENWGEWEDYAFDLEEDPGFDPDEGFESVFG